MIERERTYHGMSNTRLYNIWKDMRRRCQATYRTDYPRYGGRGIKVCKEWSIDFMSFYNWSIKHGYSSSLSIDRINVNGDYCPENCRWVTDDVQANNKTNNIYLDYKGEKVTLKQACDKEGQNYKDVLSRIKRNNWPIEKALYTPIKFKGPSIKHSEVEIEGVTHTVGEWCKELGFKYSMIAKRICLGMTPKEALTKPSLRFKYKFMKYNGKTQSLQEWAKELGFKENTLQKRLEKGWTVEKTLSTSVARNDREVS